MCSVGTKVGVMFGQRVMRVTVVLTGVPLHTLRASSRVCAFAFPHTVPWESPIHRVSLPHGNGEGKACFTPHVSMMGKRSNIYFPLPCNQEKEEKGGCGKGERRSSGHRQFPLMNTLESTET